MAVCDAHYVFSLVNIGDFGSNNDSGVLQNSAMGRALERNILGVPDAGNSGSSLLLFSGR